MLERKYVNKIIINAIRECNKNGIAVEKISRKGKIKYDRKTYYYLCTFLVNGAIIVESKFLEHNYPFNDDIYISKIKVNT